MPGISRDRPKVSVGVPVFNGENYLGEALESLLAQTYDDLEVVICDNASTDGTEAIARSFASRDGRVRYVRNRQNIGGPRNFNRAFRLSRGSYFKWMAHDDVCRPDFVRRCVEVLDNDATAVLAYPSPLDIDEHGRVIGPRDAALDFGGSSPFERFRDQMIKAHAGLHLFGVVRSNVLARTGLHGPYVAGDRVLLAELALYGTFVEIPDQLYLHREHAGRGTYEHRTVHEMMVWHDPKSEGRLCFPVWRRLAGYVTAAIRAPIGTTQTARCLIQMARWSRRKRNELFSDLTYNARLMWSLARAAGSTSDRLPSGSEPRAPESDPE